MEIEKFKQILKDNEISGGDLAEEIGLTRGSYSELTRINNKKVPRWITMFMMGFRLGQKTNKNDI